jgi:hypothetical protein
MILVLTVSEGLGKELLEVANAQGEGVNRFVEKDLEERWLPHLTPDSQKPIQLEAFDSEDELLKERSA